MKRIHVVLILLLLVVVATAWWAMNRIPVRTEAAWLQRIDLAMQQQQPEVAASQDMTVDALACLHEDFSARPFR